MALQRIRSHYRTLLCSTWNYSHLYCVRSCYGVRNDWTKKGNPFAKKERNFALTGNREERQGGLLVVLTPADRYTVYGEV